MMAITSLELCAGAGGQALGLELAGIEHSGLMEIDSDACATLLLNRPSWNVHEADLTTFDAGSWKGVDLVTGGLPCPPYSIAGKQLGPQDERDLFGHGLRIIDQVRPRGVMIENVKGILSPRFEEVRLDLKRKFRALGYDIQWRLLNASDFGVPQLRPRVVFVALPVSTMEFFEWPTPNQHSAPTVGEALLDLMSENGWPEADKWAEKCDDIAPTLVGGSKKHGGPDLGPTRAKRAWEALGVNGKSLAETAPLPDFEGMPRLTVRMAARLQGFPDTWKFHGRKTTSYRQVANAFPAPVAKAVAVQIRKALEASASTGLVKKTHLAHAKAAK
ncbi:DNA cytosine methyltransferase [Gluconobacter sp. OJA]|uniref:DNA cytosine methyltransferase n=1 Tax=Gluconobacter sp. OJA TaxID=3145197 RepID=UPI0031F74F48